MQNVLLLEDVPDAQRWLSAALDDAFDEIEITYSSTLKEALALTLKQEFDIALIDLKLPDGSGVDVIRQIKRLFPKTLCIVVTIYDDDQFLFPALQAGAQGYLLKDLSKKQISKHLRGIAKGEPPLSPAIARRLLSHFGNIGNGTEADLTLREQEVLALIAKGIKLIEVADLLGISRHTAAGYVKEIYRKLNISSRAEATMEAMRRGLISPN